MRRIARMIGFCLGLPLLLVGAFALIRTYLPDLGLVSTVHDLLITLCVELSASGLPGVPNELPSRMDAFFARSAVLYGFAPGGLALIVLAVVKLDLQAEIWCVHIRVGSLEARRAGDERL